MILRRVCDAIDLFILRVDRWSEQAAITAGLPVPPDIYERRSRIEERRRARLERKRP